MTIKTLKNFASMDKSFKEWLTTCPKEYIWQIDEVTKDQGTFIFRRTKWVVYKMNYYLNHYMNK